MEYDSKFGIIEAALFFLAIIFGLIHMVTELDIFFWISLVFTIATIITIMLECIVDG